LDSYAFAPSANPGLESFLAFLGLSDEGGAGRGRKLIGWNRVNLIVGWCGRFLFLFIICPDATQSLSL